MATRLKTRAATVGEQAQARGLSSLTGAAPVKGAQRAAAAMGERVSRAWGAERQRSASIYAMRMQIGNLCMRAMKWDARQQLQELYGGRGSKTQLIDLEVKTLDNRP
eukprot:6185844-Pleurochrysis_carterae.AAC.1